MSMQVTIPEEHRAYLIRTQLVGPAIINAVLSVSITWYFYHEAPYIPVWHPQGIAFDAVLTLFLIPFLICLISTPLVKLAAAYGKVSPLGWSRAEHPWLGRMPQPLILRSLVFGLLGVVLGGPIVIGGLILLQIHGLWLTQFLVFKGIYAALVAVIASLIVATCALADAGEAA